jgi:hypothetical protein
MARRLAALSCCAALLGLMPGCNALTGADDLQIRASGAGGGDASGSDGAGAGVGGATGTTTSATSGGPTTTTGTTAGTLVDATGVTITQIAVYQGVKSTIFLNGSAVSSNVPLVADREALVRVFVDIDPSYHATPITARLTLGSGAPIEVVKSVFNDSSEENLGTTINFEVPAASMVAGLQYGVELLQTPDVSAGNNPAARYPQSGLTTMNVTSVGSTLRIALVPVAYGADGSNRVPDVSSAQIARYENAFYSMYPVPRVEITVEPSVGWDQSMSASGGGWDSLLNALANYRADESPPNDVYYYGIVNPASSASQYCGGGCVAGLGMIAGPSDPYGRVAIGLGYAEFAHETAVHELGHNHGRQHAPCGGASGIDPNYPHSGASIGVWGYDLVSKELINPSGTTDIMGYCQTTWVSDYTFAGLFQRIKFVNGASIQVAPEDMDREYERAQVDADGNLQWLSPVRLHTPPMNQAAEVVLESGAGDETVAAQFYPYDHLPGGVYLWRASPRPSDSVLVVHDDLATRLYR